MILGTILNEYPICSTEHMVLTVNGEVISTEMSVQQVVNITMSIQQVVNITLNLYE